MITSLKKLMSPYSYLRLATNSDNNEILKFLMTVPMETNSMVLRHDRSPDYFAFSNQQGVAHFSFIFENKDRSLGGIASLSLRDHYTNGRKTRVAYLCDLRIHPRLYRRTRVEWRKCYTELIANYRYIEEFENCEYFYSAILENNRSAINALTTGKSDFIYREMGTYHGLHILARLPGFGIAHRVKRFFSNIGSARRASENDTASLRRFMNRQNQKRLFAEYITPYGNDELERRFNVWNDFSIASFIIVENKNHEILGCASPWSEERTRRWVIEKIPFKDRVLNTLLPLLGGKRFIENQPLATLNLSHLEINSDLDTKTRRKIFLLLLDYIFAAGMHKGYHLVSLLDRGNPDFCGALQLNGFVFTTTRGIFYQVMSARDLQEGHIIPNKEDCCPKFELAIA